MMIYDQEIQANNRR